MPAPKRPRRALTHDFDQIRLYGAWNEQEAYEILRPISLFGLTAAERAPVAGVAERTLVCKADLFDAQGMARLFDQQPAVAPEDGRQVPADNRQRVLSLKAEWPAFRPREIEPDPGRLDAAGHQRPHRSAHASASPGVAARLLASGVALQVVEAAGPLRANLPMNVGGGGLRVRECYVAA